MRIQAVGYYGWDNFGDELFREVIEANCALLWGGSARLGTSTFPIRTMHQNTGPVGAFSRGLANLAGAAWAQRIALCGGSVLADVRGNSMVRNLIFQKSRSFEALGVSLGPWGSKEAERRVMDFVDRMERVVVRDGASYERADGKAILGGDLAALYPAVPTASIAAEDYVAICPSTDARLSSRDLLHVLRPMLKGNSSKVRVVALNAALGRGDLELSNEISSGLRECGVESDVVAFSSVAQIFEVLGGARAVIAQRLHGLIAAYLCDVPIVALSHHVKVKDFADHIGLSRQHLWLGPGDESTDLPSSIDEIVDNCYWELPSERYRTVTREALEWTGT